MPLYRSENWRVTQMGATKNTSGKFSASPKFLVMHYTAAGGGEGSAHFLFGPHKPASSAHFVVDRDGDVWQLIDTGYTTWHAGESFWKGLSFLNRYAIGIEFANYGYWRAGIKEFDDSITARHKNGGPVLKWENYPDKQIESGMELTSWILANHKNIREIVGHDDIAPKRKSDPGPAFPMMTFRNLLLADQSKPAPVSQTRYQVNATKLNVRGGPGTEFETLDWGPLVKGTRVTMLSGKDDWSYVKVEDKGEGWAFGQYLTPV